MKRFLFSLGASELRASSQSNVKNDPNPLVKAQLVLLALLGVAISPIAAALTIPAQWKYSSAELGPGSLFFDSGDAACAYSAVPMYERACVRMSTTYSNAHYFVGDPQYGQGCSYTITSWANCPYSYPPSTGYAQNWVLRQAVCPWPLTQSGSNCVGPDDVTPPNCCYLTQNPVQISKGWKFWSETDFAKPFQFTRYYTSRPTNNFLNGGLSPHWRHTYDRSVSATTDPTKVWLLRPDGSYMPFSQGSNGSWTPIFPSKLRLSSSGSGYAVVTEQDDQETYNANGVLTSIQTRDGRVYTLRYDDWGLLASVTDDQGRVLAFTATSNHANIASVTDPSGTQLQFQYTQTSVTQLTGVSWTDAGGGVRQRTYLYEASDPTLLTGIIDESGQRYSTYAYDSSGRVTSTALWSDSTHQVNQTSFTYPNGTTTTVTSPLGAASTYTSALIAGAQRMTANTVPCAVCGSGTAKAMSYDSAGYAQSTTDFNGNIVQQTYDDTRGLETQRIDASGSPSQRTITTLWDPNFRVPDQRSTVNASNTTVALTTWSYNARGQVLSRCQIDPAVNGVTSYVCGSSSAAPSGVRQWMYTYCEQSGITAGTCPLLGLVLSVDGPRTDVSDVASYTYYQTTDLSGCATGGACHSLGDLRSVTDALGHVTTYSTYNGNGYPLTMTDPNGIVTTLTYDVRQHLTSRTVGTETTSFAYYPTGLLNKITLPDGSFLSYLYDRAHRLTEIDDSLGNRMVYTLDAMGNRTAENLYDPSNALTRTHSRVFNSLSQLWKDITAAGTTAQTTIFGYDGNSNQTTINAPLSRNTTDGYDALNRLTQVTDPNSGITQFGYDANDNLTSVIDPRTLVTSYQYNALGDLTQQVSPDTGTTNNIFDSAGNLATGTDARGQVASYSYDALNRVMQLAYTDQTIGYTYDQGANGVGRLSSVSDASGSTSWTYTSLGRVASKTQTMGSIAKTVSYAYNSAGQLTSLTTPSGEIITYGYTNNQVTSIAINGTPLLSNVLYAPFGPTSGWTWGNGTYEVRTYDQDGKITQVDGAGLRTYVYDDAFRVTSLTDTVNNANSWNYGYDLLDRLTAATGSVSQTFSFDANGNRLTQGGTASSTFTNATTSNRLNSVTGALSRTYSYDNAGNITGDGTNTFTYNNAGRSTSVTTAGVTTSYAINALGQRVKKSSSSGATYFVYDEAGHLIGEYNGAGNIVQETVWMGDIPVATLQFGTSALKTYYVHTDHLNTPRRITNRNTNIIVWRWDSDPFGNGAAVQNPQGPVIVTYNLRFPGQYVDSETGLFYNYFRDYDPAVGRYVESDPVGLAGGVNTYGYANASPMMLGDLLGLAASCGNDDRCAQLRKQIFAKSAALLMQLTKYDPIADGRGGFKTPGGGTTGPGGHHDQIVQLQQGLKNDIAEYKRLCSNDGNWPNVPRSIDETANRSVPEPLIVPGPESPVDQPNNQNSWVAIAGALLFWLRFAPALAL